MRIESPNQMWHGPKDRILCIDFHPFSNEMLTAGSDDRRYKEEEIEGTEGSIKIWVLTNIGGKMEIKIQYGLI